MNIECRILNIDFRKAFIFTVILFSSLLSFSQNIPTLHFQKDSVLIGEPTPLIFTYSHSSIEEVLFADSTYDFTPFEFEKIEFFNTSTTDSISTDSVIYWVSTFELDKIQTLKIPVFIFNKKDSIPVYSNIDSILLTEVITVVSDTLKFKENTEIQLVENEFNYPIFSIVLGGIALVVFLLLIIFRRKIIVFFKLKRLEKRHKGFKEKFSSSLEKYSTNESKENLEDIIITWKKYLEKLREEPFTKLSTKELHFFISDEEVISTLKKSDEMIFGNVKFENAIDKLNNLNSFVEKEYLIKIEVLRNERNK